MGTCSDELDDEEDAALLTIWCCWAMWMEAPGVGGKVVPVADKAGDEAAAIEDVEKDDIAAGD